MGGLARLQAGSELGVLVAELAQLPFEPAGRFARLLRRPGLAQGRIPSSNELVGALLGGGPGFGRGRAPDLGLPLLRRPLTGKLLGGPDASLGLLHGARDVRLLLLQNGPGPLLGLLDGPPGLLARLHDGGLRPGLGLLDRGLGPGLGLVAGLLALSPGLLHRLAGLSFHSVERGHGGRFGLLSRPQPLFGARHGGPGPHLRLPDGGLGAIAHALEDPSGRRLRLLDGVGRLGLGVPLGVDGSGLGVALGALGRSQCLAQPGRDLALASNRRLQGLRRRAICLRGLFRSYRPIRFEGLIRRESLIGRSGLILGRGLAR